MQKTLRDAQIKRQILRQSSRDFINQFKIIKQVAKQWYMPSDMCNCAWRFLLESNQNMENWQAINIQLLVLTTSITEPIVEILC